MKKSWIIIGGIVVAVLVALAALQAVSGFAGRKMVETMMEKSSGDKADVNVNADGTVNVKTEDGEFTTGNTMPKDWPNDAPAYPGATVEYSASGTPTDGKAGSAIIMMSDDNVATITAYYETTLKTNGWTVSDTMESGTTTILSATKDTRTLSLMISEADGKTAVTLAVETGE
jgi:hypothetical protein